MEQGAGRGGSSDGAIGSWSERPRSSSGSRPRAPVWELQRARLLNAVVDVAAEGGYSELTVTKVVARAKLSRRTFYELFDDREDCFLETVKDITARMARVAGEAYGRERAWRERIRAGLGALLGFLDEQPEVAVVCIVETLAAGPRVLEYRARLLGRLIEVIDRDYAATGFPQDPEPPPLAAEGVVGAVLAIVQARLLDRREGPLVGLLNVLTSMIVLPYRGPTAAREELERPDPTPTGAPRESKEMSWDLGMRVTYRTLRVIAAIGERPGLSNRQVAESAGIADQGQASRLLSRLERLELVHNTCPGNTSGEANAWRLTPKGTRVEQATRISSAAGQPLSAGACAERRRGG